MLIAKTLQYAVKYKKPNYSVKIDLKINRGALLKMAEKLKFKFKENNDEPIQVHPEHLNQFKPTLNSIVPLIEKELQVKHPKFKFFSIDIKDIILEKINDKYYTVKIYFEGITAYA